MHPDKIFCPTLACPARGQVGKGNLGVHSYQEKRYICHACEKTFADTKGTLFYRLRTDPQLVLIVIVLLAYGCPPKAIEQAYGFHERTIRRWWQRSGEHCRVVHEHTIGSRALDLQQVQADEIKVKAQRQSFWMALAMMVPTRLWLGGALSPRRDRHLIQALVAQIRQVALCRELLLAVDGLVSYVKAFQQAFRTPLRDGSAGRPRLLAWGNIAIVQVVKQRTAQRRLTIQRRIVQGGEALVQRLLQQTQGGGVINTAYIERLNATFRQRLAWLTRRTRHLARRADTLQAGMWVVGCCYNFCDNHHSLRLKLYVGEHGYRWVQRTPAMAAGLTTHRWTPAELFNFKVPPPRWTPPKQRGRPSEATRKLIERWC